MNVKVESISTRAEDDAELGGVFVYARATLHFQEGDGSILLQTLDSGGIVIAEDEDADYSPLIEDCGKEQREELLAMLTALGLSAPGPHVHRPEPGSRNRITATSVEYRCADPKCRHLYTVAEPGVTA